MDAEVVGQRRPTLGVVGTAARSENELNPEERLALEAAHRGLRDAVGAYERLTGAELKSGESVAVHDLEHAQAHVETAERELWRLREELLTWPRPTWAPGAALVADWFSEEDAVYDDITPSPGR